MATLSEKILSIDKTICRYLDQAELSERGIVSQDIIAHLIAFVEHIMLNFYSKNTDILDTTENIEKGIVNAQVTSELKELYRFHKYLNIVAIHYSLDEGNSERLMLKYYKYLLDMKKLVEKHWNIEILHNLDKFPLKIDTELEEYHRKINEYKTDTCTVIRKLLEMSYFDVEGYTESMDFKIDFGFIDVDCDEKKKILLKMFSESRVAMVYGSAGVGKTTLIKHVSKYFSDKNILFLTQTNSAKNNLEMRMKNESHSHSFSTISGFVNETTWVNSDCELLVIDESSTVSNSDMVKVLNKVNCNLMLLVGDIYQISSIRFGNWFTTARNFLPEASIFELKTPYRAKDNIQLLQF